MTTPTDSAQNAKVTLVTVVREWGRIGVIGFGGPPAHIALLRKLCVEEKKWISAGEFEDGIAAVNVLPGPASTQLAILCAWKLRGLAGAILGGVSFIVPGLILILSLSGLVLSTHPPLWVAAAATGASSVIPAVALQVVLSLAPESRRRAGTTRARETRWWAYLVISATTAALFSPVLVGVLFACGIIEVVTTIRIPATFNSVGLFPMAVAKAVAIGGIAMVALKVGALSYGGGFVIIPLMQHDAVSTHHWMTAAQFLDAVALGQITPGPVVLTVAAVGYAAGGIGGGLLATLVAFAPSFAFVVAGGPHFDLLRQLRGVRAFLTGAGAASIGAIAGSVVPLSRALGHLWQVGVLALAVVWLCFLRRGVVVTLVGAGVVGVVAGLIGAPVLK